MVGGTYFSRHDSQSRLSSVVEDTTPQDNTDAVQQTQYAYNATGSLARTDLPGGVIETFSYDTLGRLTTLTHHAADATPADLSDNLQTARFDYTLRSDGKRTGLQETFWFDINGDGDQTADELKTTSYDWTYDDIGRLTDERIDHFDDTLDQTESYRYDLTGNRVGLERDFGDDGNVDAAITYDYDSNDRLMEEILNDLTSANADTTTTYAYDHTHQAEKRVTRSVSEGSVVTTRQSLTYNLQGRLASVTTTNEDAIGGVVSRDRVNYSYDSKSYRVEQISETDSDLDGVFEFGSRTEFLVDHNNFTGYAQTLRETSYDADGNVIKQIDYTFGHDEISQRTRLYNSLGEVTQDSTHVFGHDGHGSVRAIYDMVGAITQVITYSAYGQIIAAHNAMSQSISTDQILTNLLYSGEYFDSAIQRGYNRARWYDPASAQWNRLDPFSGNMQDPQSLHKYAYVHGDPVNGIDPSGLSLLSSVAALPGQIKTRLVNLQRVIHQKRIAVAQLTLAQNVATFALAGTLAFGQRPDAALINVGWTGVNQGIGLNLGVSFLLQDGKIYLAGNFGLSISPLLTNVWMMGRSQMEYSVGIVFGMNSIQDIAGISMTASVPLFLLTTNWAFKNFFNSGVVNAFMTNLWQVLYGKGNWQHRSGFVTSAVSTNLRTVSISIGSEGAGWSGGVVRSTTPIEIFDANDLINKLAGGQPMVGAELGWIESLWRDLQRASRING